MKYLRVENAIDDFIGYAKIHGIATSDIANSKIANIAHDHIMKSYVYLKQEKAFDNLKLLLADKDTQVRSWTARFLLDIYEEESLQVLEEIAKGKAHAFSAQMIIEEFKKGNLTF